MAPAAFISPTCGGSGGHPSASVGGIENAGDDQIEPWTPEEDFPEIAVVKTVDAMSVAGGSSSSGRG
jgi:hypothetical protein